MQIALTGAAGHLGATLVRQLLEDGHVVRALIFKEDKALKGLPVETVRGNLDDPSSLRQLCDGAAVVQHLAGRISLSGQRPLFTREALSHVERGHPNVSHDKATRYLGYRPRPLEETMRDAWEWLKNHHL